MPEKTRRPVGLTAEQRDELRTIIRLLKETMNVKLKTIAHDADISYDTLKNFVSARNRSRNPSWEGFMLKLYNYITYDLSKSTLPEEIGRRISRLGDTKVPEHDFSYLDHMEQLRIGFSHMDSIQTGHRYKGLYYCYRYARPIDRKIKSAHIVKSLLRIHDYHRSKGLVLFDNTYVDSFRRKRKTNGYVFEMGGKLYLVGRVEGNAGFNMLVLTVPGEEQPTLMHGLILSLDANASPLAARMVCKRIDAGDQPTEEKLGVFEHTLLRRELGNLITILNNKIQDELVLT